MTELSVGQVPSQLHKLDVAAIDEVLRRLKGVLPQDGYTQLEQAMTIDPFSDEVKRVLKKYYELYFALVDRQPNMDNIEYLERVRYAIEVWVRVYVRLRPNVFFDDSAEAEH